MGHWPKWIEKNLKLYLLHSNIYILHIFDKDLYKNHISEVCPFEANIRLGLFYVEI